MSKSREFDASRYLDNEEVIAEYLAAALEDPDPAAFLTALGDVAKARGITRLARDAGLRRESLYNTFSPGKRPQFDTVQKIMKALGLSLALKTAVGDYTAERAELFADLTSIDDIKRELDQLRASKRDV